MNSDDAERLARLESEMNALRSEVAQLRQHLGASLRAEPSAKVPSRPPSPASSIATGRRSPPPHPKIDVAPSAVHAAPDQPSRSLEQLVGRYATVGVATLTVLIGVGIFLNWAIEHVLLGPTTRVVLGYVGALALAGIGLTLRIRGTREFGNVLLAMSLGVIHLVSWSAGPLLHVIPAWAALAIGSVASTVLAEFALRHDEETLCAIGFGGAAIAPFVLSDSDGSRIALAVYGVLVVALSAAALRRRSWNFARNVTAASLIFYTMMVGIGQPESSPPAWIAVRLWVLFPLAAMLALIPLAPPAHRRILLRWSGAALLMGSIVRVLEHRADVWALAITAVAAVVYLAVMHATRLPRDDGDSVEDTEHAPPSLRATVFDAFVMPVGLFVSTALSTPDFTSYQGVLLSAAWTLGLIWMTYASRAEREADVYASAASFVALWIVPAGFIRDEFLRVAGSTLLALGLVFVALRLNRKPFIVGAISALVTASVWALTSISELPQYEYRPFMTLQTLASLVAVGGWLTAGYMVSRQHVLFAPGSESRELFRQGVLGGAVVTAFGWGVGELQGAWNETASTALLIVYYAATGALMIWLGRRRDVKGLRLIGLGLSLWAAFKTVQEAFFIPNVAVRIGIFFVVSAFLIAVGYWYRRGAEDAFDEVSSP